MLLLTLGAKGQTLLTVTNARVDVSGDPAFILSGPVGSYRITYTVTASGEVLPLNDGSTFRLEVWAADSFRLYNLTNTLNPEVDASLGQVRFVIPSLGIGEYRLRGRVTPVSGDTNETWNLTHHYLTVTSAQAQALTLTNVNQIFLAGSTNIESLVINMGGVTNLTDIDDVDAPAPSANDTLVWDGSKWTNAPQSGSSGGGIISNVTESTSNSWDAGTGSLVINTNPPATGSTDNSGIHAPYTNAPASPVTISAANGWWQTLTATGATEILLADKSVTNVGASVRLDFWTLHSTTITNIEGYASLSISTSAVNVLLFDNPSDRGVTNWYVEQLYP